MFSRSIAVVLFLLIPTSASAAFPNRIIDRKADIERLSVEQRAEQRRLARLRAEQPPEIENRLQQKKPLPTDGRVSQRVRRAQAEALEERRSQRRTTRLRPRPVSRAPASPSQTIGEIRRGILDAVNLERARVGQPPLTLNTTLNLSAQLYAEDMLARDFFSHTSPEGEGPERRIRKAGYADLELATCGCRWFRAAYGENLALGQETVDIVMEQWMASPDHKDNIISPHFTQLGVGHAGEYWVQHFGDLQIQSY